MPKWVNDTPPVNFQNFTLLRYTPFSSQNNALHFRTKDDMLNFFRNSYEKMEFEYQYNSTKDRNTINLKGNIGDFEGYNYGFYMDRSINADVNFFFINSFEAPNTGAVTMTFIPDPIQSVSYANVLHEMLGFTFVEREHYSSKALLKIDTPWLSANTDTLGTNTNVYNIKQYTRPFKDLWVVFTTTVDLEGEFGTEKDPKLSTSNGQTFDKVTSPQNVYVCTRDNYNNMLKSLSDYPWITRNITANSLVPKDIIDNANLDRKITNGDLPGPAFEIFTLKDHGTTKDQIGYFTISFETLRELYMIPADGSQDYLLRYPYAYMTVTNYQGQEITVKYEDIVPNEIGVRVPISFNLKSVLGYDNSIYLYPANYLSKGEKIEGGYGIGTFLSNSITFSNFDSIATLTDSYKEKLGDTAHQRQLTQDKLITNRLSSFTDNEKSLQDKFQNAVSIAGNLSPTGIMSNITDEYEYYRQFNAELEDSKVSSPTLTTQNLSNSFNIANDIFGINFKLKKINDKNFSIVRKYHALYGFNIGEYKRLNEFNNTILNYVRCKADTIRPNQYWLPQFLPLVQTRLESGVSFWNAENIEDINEVFNSRNIVTNQPKE